MLHKDEVKKVMKQFDISEEEALALLEKSKKRLSKKKKKDKVPSPVEVLGVDIIGHEESKPPKSKDVGTGQLLNPEEEAKKEVSKSDLSDVQESVHDLSADDFEEISGDFPVTLTLSATKFKELAKAGVSSEAFLLARVVLVSHSEDKLTVGVGRAALINVSKGDKKDA